MATNIRQHPSSVATSLSDSGKGKEKLGESSSSSGSVGGRSVRLFSRDSGSTSWNEGSLSARGSRSGSDAPGIRHRSVEIGGSAGRQYGLKFFDRLKPGGDGVAMPTLGRQFDPVADKGLKLGPYNVIADKSRGVEPGFIGQKPWTDADTANLSADGHRLCTAADALLDKLLAKDKGLQVKARDILEQGGDSVSRGRVPKFLKNAPEERAEVYKQLKQDPEVQGTLRDALMKTDRKFAKHYVKLDYRETDSRGTGAAKKFTLPWSNAKSLVLPGILGKLIHREARYQTPDKINRDAMRESLANDLMKSFGIFAQKLKLVPTEYADGTPKLLLDGTHMSGPNGEKFSDFEGAIKNGPKNGQLVKLDGEGNPVKNASGHYEVDTSITDLGRNKIFMLLLGDRDAIGSSGGNKGRVGNMFAAIDPGHSLELGGQRQMEKRDINSDMSFKQPSVFAGKQYKNFTIFDQSPFSERMAGVHELQKLKASSKDLDVFNDYASTFSKDENLGFDFQGDVVAMKAAYEKRRDYILDVFKDRLAVYDFDMSSVGGPKAQETAAKQTLDVLDNLEKITSKHTWMAGNVELEYPQVTKRTEWNVKESGDNVEFSVAKPSRDAERRLNEFMDHAGLDRSMLTRGPGGSLTLTVPKDQIGQAHNDFSVANLRGYDRANANKLLNITSPK